MVILAIGILGLAPMVVLSIEGNSMSRDCSIAAKLAKEQMEAYESLDTIPVPVMETEDTLGYSRTTVISEDATGVAIPVGLVKVEVMVTWTDKVGVARSTKYSTLLPKEKG